MLVRKLIFYIVLFDSFILLSQNKNESIAKKIQQNSTSHYSFYAGGGISLTSVNLFKNIRRNPYVIGYDVRLFYDVDQMLRLTAQYTYLPTFDFEPTWLGVKSHTADMGFNLMAKIIDQEAVFYTITAFSYHSFKGFYTGINDFSNKQNNYKTNTIQQDNYFGLSCGAGFERAFLHSIVYLDFRYHFSIYRRVFTISDATYSLGLKKSIPIEKKKKKSYFTDKYHWF